MTLLQAYLQSPKARHALSKRPGDKGFSLIELVVVVAILAILAAVALPNFLGVSKDGQIAAAKNTLATILKECAVKETRYGTSSMGKTGSTGGGAPIQAAGGNLNGYDLYTSGLITNADDTTRVPTAKDFVTGGTKVDLSSNGSLSQSCYTVAARPAVDKSLPVFAVTFNQGTGATSKTCNSPSGTKYIEGCLKDDSSGDTQPADGADGIW